MNFYKIRNLFTIQAKYVVILINIIRDIDSLECKVKNTECNTEKYVTQLYIILAIFQHKLINLKSTLNYNYGQVQTLFDISLNQLYFNNKCTGFDY